MILLASLLVCFLLLSACASASETSLFSLSPLALKTFRKGADLRLQMISRLMERPREILVTLLILNTVCNILIQNVFSSIFNGFPDWSLRVGVPLAVTLVFAEIIPKSLALPYNQLVAYRATPWISQLTRLLGPVRMYLTKWTGYLSRGLFFFLREDPEISSDELIYVLKTSESKGVLLKQECRLIEGALTLQKAPVREVMRPREEILYYDVQEPLTELIKLFVEKECSRVPVCDGSLDQLLGIVSARIYFTQASRIQKPADLVPLLRKPFYAPEVMRAGTLLWQLREKRESIALTVDEYGSLTGLVSQEDLIEAVVGEIADQRDRGNLYTRSGDDVLIASGKLELAELRDLIGVPLHSDTGSVTLGGWLIEQMGDIPAAGTKYETDRLLFYILAADPNRIRRVYVRRLK